MYALMAQISQTADLPNCFSRFVQHLPELQSDWLEHLKPRKDGYPY
jgi:hypothetical protein